MTKNIYRPTALTLFGLATTIAAIFWTIGFILGRAPMLPPFLAMHFDQEGISDDWLRPSWTLVLLPVWIQLTLLFVFGALATVLLYRTQRTRHAVEDEVNRQDRERMLITAEAISLLAAIWVTFQALGAIRLFIMWQRVCCGMGSIYFQSLVVAIVLSVMVGIRAAVYLHHPKPAMRPTSDAHWRLQGLYFNRQDPALFVSLRSGIGWTLNFGRPRAILFIALFVVFGIGAPLVILLRLALGE
jgi:uncharacterized membrane protein